MSLGAPAAMGAHGGKPAMPGEPASGRVGAGEGSGSAPGRTLPSAPAPRESPGAQAYGTWMFTRREIERYLVVWSQTVVPPIVSAALFLFVFGHALGGRLAGFSGTAYGATGYLAFLVPGLAIQGALTNAYNNCGSSLFDARRSRYIQDVLTSPLSDARILWAYMVSGMSRAVLIGGATMLMAVPFATGWDVDAPLLAVMLVLTGCLFALLGVIVGLYATRFDHIFAPIAFLLTPLTFLGGVFYPVGSLPPNLQGITRLNPILYIVDAQRASLLGVSEYSPWPIALALAALTGLVFLVAWRLFGHSRTLRG